MHFSLALGGYGKQDENHLYDTFKLSVLQKMNLKMNK